MRAGNSWRNGIREWANALASSSRNRVRENEIETLRGLACLLLVLFHTVETIWANAPGTATESWRVLAGFFTPVRMPLFAFLSGYVFLTGIRGKVELRNALTKKFKRLGMPLITASFIYAGLRAFSDGLETFPNVYTLLLYPVGHLWFLQSAIVIAMFTTAVFWFSPTSHTRTALALFIASLLFVQLMPYFKTEFFSIRGAMGLLPYFATGMFLRCLQTKRPFARADKLTLRVVLLTITLATLVACYFIYGDAPIFARNGLAGVAASCIICSALYMMRMRIRPLWVVGPFSYTIYLYHLLFIALAIKFHALANLDLPLFAQCSLLFLAGFGGPIATHIVLARHQWGAFFLLGVERRKATELVPGSVGMKVA